MRVLLIDVDSKIPNLALMKISTYHKKRGDEVGFRVDDPDKVYISVIFTKNRNIVKDLIRLYPNSEIDIGGTGYDLRKRLPFDEQPDYSLYPMFDYSLGFSTRGCNRNCSFCFVPAKEGKFKHDLHPEKWYNPKFKKIVFMDNNILFDKEWFLKICTWCIEKNLSVDFNQGLDIRLLDVDIATMLTKLKPINCFKFAYDNTNYRDSVIRGIEILKSVGFNLRSKSHFYVYCNDDNSYDDCVNRCREIKLWGSVPFVMVNPDCTPTLRLKKLKRWGCRSIITMSCDISEYEG